MRATHLCGEVFEGSATVVLILMEEHKETCLAEHEAHERATRMSLHPSAWPTLESV